MVENIRTLFVLVCFVFFHIIQFSRNSSRSALTTMATVVAVPQNAEAIVVELVSQGFTCCGCREKALQHLNKRPRVEGAGISSHLHNVFATQPKGNFHHFSLNL